MDCENGNNKVAIEAISVHVPYYVISHQEFATATNQDPSKFINGLGCCKMAVCHPTEDVVTLAAEAGQTLMERWNVDPDEIGMLVVATESGVDWAKPVASYIHQLLGISPECRVFDVQHACFGASAALAGAVSWVLSGMNQGKKALVIASDIARYEMGSPGEATQGAGAVAMLVGQSKSQQSKTTADHRKNKGAVLIPDFSYQAIYARNVMDFWRPGFSQTAVVNGRYSVECYLKSLGQTYLSYRNKGGVSFKNLRYILFHLPFPKMGWKALNALKEVEDRISGTKTTEEELVAIYEEKVLPGTTASREIGNIYCGSLYMSLASLLETEKECAQGEKVGLFSYGSGSCAEFFIGTIGSNKKIWDGRINLFF